MADRQAQVPGGVYYNDVEEATLYQRQVPGAQYVNDTAESAGGGGASAFPATHYAMQWRHR